MELRATGKGVQRRVDVNPEGIQTWLIRTRDYLNYLAGERKKRMLREMNPIIKGWTEDSPAKYTATMQLLSVSENHQAP